jgi:hypothetical protein
MKGSELRPGERVKDIRFTEDTLAVDLLDGRTIIVPLVWYPKLLDASPEQRRNWRISGAGYGIHWPDPGRGSNCAQRAPLGNATPA